MAYTDSQWKDLLTAVDGQTITYDAIGNPTNYYDGSTMAWAEGRRLQSITQNGQTHSYQYNADGLRIKKTNPDGTYIVYHIADGRYVGETHYNELNHRVKYLRYTYDENDRVCGIGVWYAGQSQAWEEYYFETNLQGDVIAVYTAANGTNELPQLVASYTYDAWGNILTSTGSLADLNPFRYRGYYYDAETEFYYLQSRYYDPQTGRFLNADGFVSTGQGISGYNMFAYCGNNPISQVDDSGMRYCAATTVSGESKKEREKSCIVQREVSLAKKRRTILDIWAEKGVVFDPDDYGNGGEITNSYLITDGRQMTMYASYLMYESEYASYFSGSLEGFVFEWDVHNLACDYYTKIGDTVQADKAKHLNVGRTIYEDDHGFFSYAMLRAFETLYPNIARQDLWIHNELLINGG